MIDDAWIAYLKSELKEEQERLKSLTSGAIITRQGPGDSHPVDITAAEIKKTKGTIEMLEGTIARART